MSWTLLLLLPLTTLQWTSPTHAFTARRSIRQNGNNIRHAYNRQRSVMKMSILKPAAIPLLEAGKAMANSGELLIDITDSMGLFGGGLSAAGAGVRNSGNCVAQAAASCRFKAGLEIVSDELREAGTCLNESFEKLKLAVQEAEADDENLAAIIGQLIEPTEKSSIALEAAGAEVMRKSSPSNVGSCLVDGGTNLTELSNKLKPLIGKDPKLTEQCCDRLSFAASRMILAGNNLQGIEKPKPKGKAWLKGGL